MADQNLTCFKNIATEILSDEIDLNERTKLFAGTIAISTGLVSGDVVTKVLGKPARGDFKSIQDHLSELENLTTNFSEGVTQDIENGINSIIDAFRRGPNEIIDTVQSQLLSVLSVFSADKSTAFNMAKNASKFASNQAKKRIETSGNIINLINSIRAVRSNINPDVPFIKTPTAATKDAIEKLLQAKGYIQIVSGRLYSNPLNRELFTYDRALERISLAIDELKIGTSNYSISEYLKLKNQLAKEIEDFEEYDLDIDLGIQNYRRMDSDFEDGKNEVGRIESQYIQQLLERLSKLIEVMQEVDDRNSDALTLNNLELWTAEAVTIYGIAHQVFDQEIQNALDDQTNDDRQQYDTAKAVYDGLDTKASEQFLIDLKALPDIYFQFLFGKFTEAYVREAEQSIQSQILTITQEDQTLVSTDSGYSPTPMAIIGTLLSFSKKSGLDQLGQALLTGDMGSFFRSMTSGLGSRASEAAGCLGAGFDFAPDLETQQFLQNVNSAIQGIQNNKQLAGSTRENAFKKSNETIDSRTQELRRLRDKLQNIGL